MFKKWKEKDSDKERKDRKEASKRDANRGKEKKSFGDVLAGFENISGSSSSTKENKDKGVFGFAARRTQSEKRRKDDEAAGTRRDLKYQHQVSADSGKADFSADINGKATGPGRHYGRPNDHADKEEKAAKTEEMSSRRTSKVEVSISSIKRANSEKTPARKESIKVASGSEVTVNIGLPGLGSEIMAGLGNGTREFLISKAPNDEADGKIKGLDLHLPELKIVGFETGRVLNIKRRPIGDFGFALRRSTYLGDKSKIIHLAEALGDEHDTGLMPGDRLVEVNGLNVENASREQIIDMISSSGDEVAIKVVPVPELTELSRRTIEVETVQSSQVSPGNKGFSLARSGSMRNKRSKVKSEADLASEKAWLDAEKVWLNHSEGFSAGRVLKRKEDQGSADDSTCLVKLDHGGEVIEVEEEQIAKANPPQYDRAEDLASLRHLNESACLHTLRQRFGSKLIHSYGGPNLMVINPREELGIYSDKLIEMFRGCKQEDMPPHIYAMAQTSYRNMQAMRMDQSIILLGRSGSGKTANLKHLVHYYTSSTVSMHSNVSAQKMEAVFCLLDSFGTAKSYLCDSASRFSLLLTLEYDLADLLIGASLQTYLLEKTRVTKRQIGESSFKIFYDLILGCDEKLRKELYLDATLKDDNNFINVAAMDIDRMKCLDRWMELQFALEALDISTEEAKGLWAPIAAIFHLGAAGISVGNSPGPPCFANQAAAQRAASALGTTEAELYRIIFSTGPQTKPRQSTDKVRSNSDSPESGSSPQDTSQGSGDIYQDALDGFVMGLYVETFSALIRLINRCISTSSRVSTTLQILDSPGFQDPISVHPKTQGATFEDLCYNYACEKLHWFLHFATFTSQLDRYNRENIDCNFEVEDTVPPNATLAALDKLNMDRRAPYAEKNDPRGIFWILEDEAMRSSANDEGLVEKIIMQHGGSKDDSVVKPGDYSDTFKLSHLQKTVDVTYCTNGWLKRVKEHPTIKIAYTLLAESKKPHVADLYVGHRSGVLQVEIARTRSVKKRSAHGPTIPAIKKNSACMLLKMQMDTLLETLRRTNCRFVHCFLPDVNAGVPASMPKSPGSPKSPTLSLDVPLLRKQFRSSRVLQGIRMHRQGYPEFMAFGEFRRRFDILLPRNERQEEPVLDEKQVVEKMVEHMELDRRSYRIGMTQIFFRSGSLPQLEDARDEKLNDTIVEFQSVCRGYIGRRKLKQLRVQLIAITCLQRNIRKYMAVKNWDWWRLYTKVAPLLDVHRTEEELKSKTGELGLLKSKLEKLENENKELVTLNVKLKKKVSDLSVSISQIESSVAGTNELLEHESSERSRLEEELEHVKIEHEKLLKEHEHVQTELLEAKVSQPLLTRKFSAIGNDEQDVDDSFYKMKYNALSEEVQNLREKLLHEVEEEIETLTVQKRQAEKQLAEEQEEAEDLRKQLANSKRKFGKFNEEMQDMKLILETSHIRNAELEKKQRKFDQQMNILREELQQEKSLREDAQRDKDVLTTNKFALENELKEKEEDLSRLQKQADRFQNEFNDFGGVSGDTDVLLLKRDKRELELKVHDQEEELDEQAGQIQMLEQAKLRLEMQSQRDKQQCQRDLENKDDEMEEMRSDYQKKMRQLQEQIEEEYREKNDAVKMRRELERKVFELQNSYDVADRGSEKKLRKEVKKLRILYKDAKYALENQASQNTDKVQIKQLRNQLEDVEFAKHIAVKSKKQLEGDIDDLQKQLEEMTRSKQEADDRNIFLSRENADILSKIEDGEDEIDELLKKNKQQSSQISTLENALVENNASIQTLTAEKDLLDSKVQQLTTKLSFYEETTVDRAAVQRLEAKVRDLESKLDLESTLKNRLEQQVGRLKNNIANLQDERDSQTNRESRMKGDVAKCQRQMKDMKEEVETLQKREDEQKRRREAAESEIESLEQALTLLKTEQNLSNKRIRDLQEALEREMMASSSDDDDLSDIDSDAASISSRFSVSGKRSIDRRSVGHYDRSTRLRRRLNALEDEPGSHSLPRKTSSIDYDLDRRSSWKGSRDSRGSSSGRTSSMDGYGLSSRNLNGSLDSGLTT